MAEKLIITEARGFRITWFDDEDGDTGASIGDQDYGRSDLQSTDIDVRECAAIHFAIIDSGLEFDDSEGIAFYNEHTAKKGLAIANRALKICRDPKSQEHWPAWAIEAHKHGWKAPKGWRP